MVERYTSEEFWKLYKSLPKELKDALFAEETGENIYKICRENEILEYLDEIVELVGNVLLGVLAPVDFAKELGLKLNLDREKIRKIIHQFNRLIFFPVKDSLFEIYKSGALVDYYQLKEKEPVLEKKDIYREPIE